MKITLKSLVPFLVAGGILAVAGCQLIVDFDRTLIDAGSVDASIDIAKPDTSVADTGSDVTTTDASDGSTSDASDGSTSDASDGSTSDASDGSTSDASDAASE
jgi:hypothetical protein